MKIALHTHTAADDTFIIAAPTYKIMAQSTLPAFKAIMADYWEGNFNAGAMEFRMPGGGTLYFRTGTDPDSVVGMTNVRHVWGDEAGKFSLYFWENLQARASFKEAPITLTTSPYSLNWIYKEIIRPLKRKPDSLPDVLYVKARSDENPYFPRAEYERKRSTMDPRRFQMMYGGEFDKMEGLVYQCFDEVENVVEPFALPSGTRVVAGVDWGYSHPFVIVVRAITPDGHHFQVAEFYKTQLTIDRKIEAAKRLQAVWNIERFYCDPANPDDIRSFNEAKLPAEGANNSLQGIEKHYELIKTRRYKMFRGANPHTEDEYEAYHWPEDDADINPDKDVKEPTPVDQDNHAMDANRYATVMTWQGSKRHIARVPAAEEQRQETQHARIERLKRPLRVSGSTENW